MRKLSFIIFTNYHTMTKSTKLFFLLSAAALFYGCTKWPECDFVTWDKPTDEKCPKCGKSLFKGKGGMISCPDSACGYTAKAARKNAKKTQED